MVMAGMVDPRQMQRETRLLNQLSLFFLCKPSLDLLYAFQIFSLGQRGISPLHLIGIAVFLYLGRLAIGAKLSLPGQRLFVTFIGLNFVSIGFVVIEDLAQVNLVRAVDIVLRIMDSYLMYVAGGVAAKRASAGSGVKLIHCIAIGCFIAVLINSLAIAAGMGMIKAGSNNSLRQVGLYHDAGVLAKVAMYAVVFSLFDFHLNKSSRKSSNRLLFTIVSIGLSLFMIFSSVSRTVIVLLPIVFAIYMTYYHKGAGRILTVLLMVMSVAMATVIGFDFEKISSRFSSEIRVITDPDSVVTKTDKDVNLGAIEGFGSNRGQLIAYSLDEFIKRDAAHQLVGDFHSGSAHSDYFDILGRLGYFGLTAYVLFLSFIWIAVLRIARRMTVMYFRGLATVSLSLVTIHILMAFPFRPIMYTTTSWFMFTVLGFVFVSVRQLDRENYVRWESSSELTCQIK